MTMLEILTKQMKATDTKQIVKTTIARGVAKDLRSNSTRHVDTTTEDQRSRRVVNRTDSLTS